MPLYKEDLKDAKCECGTPGCEDPLFLHSKCHPEEPTWVSYFDGILTVRCSVCDHVLEEFAVASRQEKT